MKTLLIGAGLFGATAAGITSYPYATVVIPGFRPTPPEVVQPIGVVTDPATITVENPRIDLVFALDTTSSMSSMISAAKEKIWSIAASMANAQPAPDIRVGLVAFRDRGDAYVTKVIDLTDDLDSMYATLMDFEAAGGGDGPESVNQALYDAVNKMSWTQEEGAYKVVFLVGDAPAHMDYANDVDYMESVDAAQRNGIVINTIQCGIDPETTHNWQHIANLGQGQYFQVGQSGNAVAVATPFDAELATLSKALDDTRLSYGDEDDRIAYEKKSRATDKLHEEASVASRARRAMFNLSTSGRTNAYGDKDLVEDVTSGRVDLSTIAPASLPAQLRALDAPAAEAVITQTAEQRAELNRQIQSLADKRKEYIEAELEKQGGAGDSLDENLFSTIREQAADKGLRYDAESMRY